MTAVFTSPLDSLLVSDEAERLIRKLETDHGALTFHISATYGYSVVCFPAGDFRTGGDDVQVGDARGIPVYMMNDDVASWRDMTMIIDVQPGMATGFSLEAGCGVHFSVLKRPPPATRMKQSADIGG
jgi:uncharacterized protein